MYVRTGKVIVTSILLICCIAVTSNADPSRNDVLDAMKKASEFMVNDVSTNGGYANKFTADLSTHWGEAPFRPTMISVQNSTPRMGQLFLDMYEVTGDEYYLECSKKAANALIWGQHPLGGWNYYIDFNPVGILDWYENVFSQHKWGMEEWRHYYGNCTYDDGSTTSPTLFLLRLYMMTLDPSYRAPLIKALDFILMSQYPAGGWPQRYPLRYEFVHDGLPDYTSYYTFNDGGTTNQIDVLLDAYEQLGNEEYLKAAIKGFDFIIVSRTAPPYAGWAQQHDMDLKPTWARTHEPAGLMQRVAIRLCGYLMKGYTVTGDRRYLAPIPAALDWLDTTYDTERYVVFNPDTNEPTYMADTERVNEEGYGLRDYPHTRPRPDGGRNVEDQKQKVRDLRDRYARISALSPEDAVAEYRASREVPIKLGLGSGDPDTVEDLIDSMDSRGAWIVDVGVRVVDQSKVRPDAKEAIELITIQGITTASYMDAMREFMGFISRGR
jgi:PelA/Pel-15E family pectate lyase